MTRHLRLFEDDCDPLMRLGPSRPADSYRSGIGEPERDGGGLFVLLTGFVLGGITGALWTLGIVWWMA